MKKILILIILFLLTIGGKVAWGQNPSGDIESKVNGVCDEVALFLDKKKFIVYNPGSGEPLPTVDITYEFFLWELKLIERINELSKNVRNDLYSKLEGKPQLDTLRNTELSLMETGAWNSCYLTFLRILVGRGKKLLGEPNANTAFTTARETFKNELLPDEETIRKKGISISYNALVSTTTEFYNKLKQIVYGNLPPRLPDNINENIKQCISNMSTQIVSGEEQYTLNSIISKNIVQFYTALNQKKSNLNNEQYINELPNAVNVFASIAEKVKEKSANFRSNILKKGIIFINVLKDPNSCTTTQQEFRQAVQETFDSMNELEGALQDIFFLVETPAEIKVETTTVPIAVIPPIIFIDEHKGTSSFAELLPENIFEEIRNFIFKLAPPLFLLLLVIGGLYYLASPVDIKNIITGTGYIKYAVLGYFLLLVITAVITAIKTIFGGP